MATSPDYVRLATSATRTLTDLAFDAGRDAVVVVDVNARGLPLVLANAAARRALGFNELSALVATSLYGVLGGSADSAVEAMLGSERNGLSKVSRLLEWRLPSGPASIKTELQMLSAAAAGQRLLMLAFAEPAADTQILAALEQLPLDLMILDRDLNVKYASAHAARTAELQPSDMVGLSALTVMPTAGIDRDAFRRILAGAPAETVMAEIAIPCRAARQFKVDLQPLKDGSGVAGMAVVSMEVTERRAPNRAAGNSERRLIALTEHAHDVITIAGRRGEMQYVSGGLKNLLGYSVGELNSGSIFDQVHPDDVADLRLRYRQLVAGERENFVHEFRIRHQDGGYRWFEASYVAALDNPLIKGVVINARDITERKAAESRLAQREEIFRLAADAVDGVIFEWDVLRGVVDRSRGVLEVLGIDPKTLPSTLEAWSERIHPRDAEAYRATIGNSLAQGRGWTSTYRILDGRGRYRSMLERTVVQRNALGEPVRAIGCAVDVSEIKRLTDLLAETQRSARMGGWEYGVKSGELRWTEEMFKIFETTPQEFPLSWQSMLSRCLPESRRRLDDAIRFAEKTAGGVDLEIEIRTLLDRRLWVRVIGHLEFQDGEAVRAFGSVQNIQATKLAQVALENSTDWLKLSMNMANMHAWRWNTRHDTLDYAIVDGQEATLPVLLPTLKRVLLRVHPEDRDAVRRAVDAAFTHQSELQIEFRLRLRGGRHRSYATVARPAYDGDGRPSGLVGVTQDVTSRREADERVRRSEEVLRTTTATTADTLILLDAGFRVRFINREFAGFAIEDIIGSHVSALIPAPARARVLGKLNHSLRFDEPATFEYELKQPGADILYFESSAVPVRDGLGSGLSLTVRDITERKRMEQEILDIASRERHAIGRDLHDGLGQELTGVALMLRGLTRRIEKESPGSVEAVDEIVGLVNQSIETTRSLARGLLPVRSDSGGLQLALRTLAARSREAYGLDVTFRSELWPAPPFSEADASHLYRIAQEALTNAARHGHASSIDIFLLVTSNTFLLRIADDGVGLGDAAQSAPGMGLRIMKYRAGMIGAKFEIGRNEPRGTVIRVIGEEVLAMSALESVQAI